MVLPELWSKSSHFSLLVAIAHLKKYSHLLNWKKQESILEFGFANGYNSCRSLVPLLPNDYKEFFGTDLSSEMIEDAKKQCLIPRSTFLQMDITSKIPAEFQNRFDHVFSFNSIHRVNKPR